MKLRCKRQVVTVQTTTGHATVTAYTHGDFGYHLRVDKDADCPARPRKNGNNYAVTHIPSQRNIHGTAIRLSTIAEARSFLSHVLLMGDEITRFAVLDRLKMPDDELRVKILRHLRDWEREVREYTTK